MLKTSDEWAKALQVNEGVVVLDHDGWDRREYEYSWYQERITEEEFNRRVSKSTTIKIEQEYTACNSISQQD